MALSRFARYAAKCPSFRWSTFRDVSFFASTATAAALVGLYYERGIADDTPDARRRRGLAGWFV